MHAKSHQELKINIYKSSNIQEERRTLQGRKEA
jgi:hypothetical protein